MEKSIAKNALFNILYKVLNVLFPLVTTIYISRILCPAGVGKVAFAQNVCSYFTVIAALGLPTYGIREIARHRNDRNKVDELFSDFFWINIISTSLCVIVYLMSVVFFFKSDTLLFLACGLSLFFNYLNIDWLYQGLEEYVYIAIRSSIVKCLSLIAVFVFVRTSNDYIIYALIISLALGINNIYNIFYARRFARIKVSGLHFKKHLRSLLILLSSSLAIQLYSMVDTTMLGAMYNDSIVGFYSNAQKTVNLALTVVSAISAVFFPRLSFYFKSNRDKFNRCVSSACKIVIYIALPSSLGIFLVSDDLVEVLFGSSFAPSISIIRILSVLLFVKSIGDVLAYQVMIATGHETWCFYAYAIAAFVNIVLNFVLIPVLQANGAALASVAAELTVNVPLILLSIRMVRINLNKKYIFSCAISIVFMFIVVLFLKSIISNPFVSLIFSVLFGIFTYYISTLIFRNEIASLVFGKIKKVCRLM